MVQSGDGLVRVVVGVGRGATVDVDPVSARREPEPDPQARVAQGASQHVLKAFRVGTVRS